MGTSLRQICDYLERDGRRYLVDPDGQVVHCRQRGPGGQVDYEVRVSEEGAVLHLRAPRVATLGTSPHRAVLLERLLELHFQIKVGRFGLDPAGGEVDCEVILPLEDAPLTFRQLQRCVAALVLLVQQHRPRFEAILATGDDPARDEGAQLDQFVDQLAALFGVAREEILAQLADAHPPPGGNDG